MAAYAAAGSLVYSGIQEGRALKAQAKAEKSSARNREIERKRNLIDALASQNVRIGASGVTGGAGSSADAVMKGDIDRFKLDQIMDKTSSNERISQLNRNADTAFYSSLLSAGSEASKPGRRSKKRGSV